MRIQTGIAAAIVAAATVGLTIGAVASHGKVGLWSVDMTIVGHDASQMPENALAAMKARGMTPNTNGGFTFKHCMTATDVADDNKMLSVSSNKDCKIDQKTVSSSGATATLVCKGQVNGTGHLVVNYDSSTHYTAELLMTVTSPDGTSATQDQKFEGHWVAGTCPAEQ